MDHSIPPVITSISWALSEVVGIYAALQAGAQGGVVGELPFADLLSAVGKDGPPNGESGDNVFIGVESQWLRMMLKSFRTRQLKFSYLQLRESSHSRKCGYQSDGLGRCIAVTKPPNCVIEPNMFFGLINSDEMETKDDIVVHRAYCLLKKRIDKRAIEFLPKALMDDLKERSNEDALQRCLSIINSMSDALCNCDKEEANFWDRRIIVRIQKLIEILSDRSPELKKVVAKSEFLRNATIERLLRENTDAPFYYKKGDLDNADVMNEVLDRISSRIPAMLERLELTEFEVLDAGDPSIIHTFTIADVKRAFIICLGIMRATIMSDYIYKHGGVVAMGYNVNVAHELMEDVSKMPVNGYSSRLVIESTAQKRLVETEVSDSHVYYGLLLDVTISTSIMLLSGLGPIISMFAARQLSAPYRESTMNMGTSMSWAVSHAVLLNTGEARDDWMACILPRRHTLDWFLVLSMLSSLGPPLLWTFHHPPVSSISRGGWLICVASVAFGLAWLLSSYSIAKQKQLENAEVSKGPFDDDKPKSWWSNPIYTCALAVIAPLALFLMDGNWVWLYLLEVTYGLQWLYGEASDQWMHKSTALLMLGMLGAMRLYDLA